jgi:regulator of protease activity HflC (stomatin/prohibitin superfamily)
VKKVIPLLLVCSMFLTGCYFNEEVETNQVGAKLNSNNITMVVGPGVYTEATDFYADFVKLDVDTQTFSVEDPEVLASDNQAVSVKITIQARRQRDDASVRNILTNWNSLKDNTVLRDTISSTAREGMKNGVRGFTLSQLLDDRNGLADAIRQQLEADTEKYSVEIVNVTVENIGVDPKYMEMLNQKALLRAETEKEKQRQELIRQQAANEILQAEQQTTVQLAQLEAEQAKTAVEVEIASREGEKTAAQYQVYKNNPQAYALEYLRRLKDVLGDKATVYFLQPGMDLTALFGLGGNSILPIQ